MIRLNVLAEGKTEQQFFNLVVRPHLYRLGVGGKVRLINDHGGWNSYRAVKRDLLRWRRQDEAAWFTTMVDLYALPGDFPAVSRFEDPYARVAALEKAWFDDVQEEICGRFVPYVQLHEFEALLFADPQQLDWEFLEHDDAIANLVAVAERYDNPELIDDGPDTAPSKRIIDQIRQYRGRKASAGPLVASKIGLPRLRQRCRHFNEWIVKLEELALTPPTDCRRRLDCADPP